MVEIISGSSAGYLGPDFHVISVLMHVLLKWQIYSKTSWMLCIFIL